jgi:hypothetical protein
MNASAFAAQTQTAWPPPSHSGHSGTAHLRRRLTARESRMLVIETLSALGGRLFDYAASITNGPAHEMEIGILLAARVCSTLATLRFRVAEIVERHWHRPEPYRWPLTICASARGH